MPMLTEEERKPDAIIVPRSAMKSQKGKSTGLKKSKREPLTLPIVKKRSHPTKRTEESNELSEKKRKKKRPRWNVTKTEKNKSKGKKKAVKTKHASPNQRTKTPNRNPAKIHKTPSHYGHSCLTNSSR
jgi:hypothetical protein